MSGTLALWQGLENDSLSANNTHWLMLFVGICAFSMLTQAIIFAVMAIGAKRAQSRLVTIAEELRMKAMPIIDEAQDLVRDTLPKVRIITDNLLETSTIVREKAEEFDLTLADANRRTRAQVARLDGMVSTGLTATGHLAEMIHQGIRTPVVEVVGLINGAKAALDVLMSKSKDFGFFAKRRPGGSGR